MGNTAEKAIDAMKFIDSIEDLEYKVMLLDEKHKALYEKEKKENAEKDARIKALESRNKLLVANLEHLRETITKALSVTAPNA